ncbi:MAG: HIT family protein [Deinococcales bacterium]
MNDSQPAPCVFCEIAADRSSAHVVWSSNDALVFLDRNPIAPGHLLIVPRRHEGTLWNLTETEYFDLMSLARSLAKALSKAMGADRAAMAVEGYGVTQAHIHLVPVNGPGELDPNRQSTATEPDLAHTASALHAAIEPRQLHHSPENRASQF